MAPAIEIICTACGADTLIKREAVYDGFKKTGESLSCLACGHVYAREDDVPFKPVHRADIFSAADRPRKIDMFESDEKGHNCRHCRHYVVNPFTQRCGLHNRPVQATDLCGDFSLRAQPEDKVEEHEGGH